MASRAILSNFFEEQWTQNHPQYLSGLSRALFPTTFLKTAVNENGIISRLLNSDNLKTAEYLDSSFSYVTAISEYALLSVRYWCHRWLCDPPVTWEPPPPPKLKCKISGSNKPLSLFLTTQKLLLYSHLSLKLFLTSDRVEVKVVRGVVRALMTKWK